MPYITLNEEQLNILTQSRGGGVEIRDPNGKCLGFVEFTSEQDIIEECKRRRLSQRPRIPWGQVQQHLQTLTEAANKGASEEELWKLLKELQTEAQQQ